MSRAWGLVLCAGLSRRMKQFKPLMELGGKPLALHCIDAMRDAGIDDIVVVTGHRHGEVEEALESPGVHFAFNPDSEATDMMASLRIGLKAIGDSAEAVVMTPADIPLARPFSIRAIMRALEQSDALAVIPSYRGTSGHPIAFSRDCFAGILERDYDDGMRGVLRSAGERAVTLALPDPGLLPDADTIEDLERIRLLYEMRDIPSDEQCEAIWDYTELLPHIRLHCRAVCQRAEEICRALSGRYELDVPLVRAAALLHDAMRLTPPHEMTCAALLEDMGYARVARAVSEHMAISSDAIEHIDERAIVYLADKLVIEHEPCSLAERYIDALIRKPELQAQIRSGELNAEALYSKLFSERMSDNATHLS